MYWRVQQSHQLSHIEILTDEQELLSCHHVRLFVNQTARQDT